MNDYFEYAWKHARRVVVAVIGGTIILLGIVGMMVPIMPGFVFIPIGLAVLATEFLWAKRWLKQVKQKSQQAWDGVTGKSNTPVPPELAPAPPDRSTDSTPDLTPGPHRR